MLRPRTIKALVSAFAGKALGTAAQGSGNFAAAWDHVHPSTPATDNATNLGSGSLRWATVYAGTGSINTSDARDKQDVRDLSDAERRVAVRLKGLVRIFRFTASVEAKGEAARLHVGLVAQDVAAAFAAEGLDATRYGLLCHDAWEAVPAEIDGEGNIVTPAVEAGDRYGLRYEELLSFVIAALA